MLAPLVVRVFVQSCIIPLPIKLGSGQQEKTEICRFEMLQHSDLFHFYPNCYNIDDVYVRDYQHY